MMVEENQEEFIVNVYACNGEISQYDYDNYDKGMICFHYGHATLSLRGDSRLVARLMALDLGRSLRKKSRVKRIKFNFPDDRISVPVFLDGYFGKPAICGGAYFLKPLSERRRIALSREINKISNVQDRWGKETKIIA